jgi:hypothetical protein
MDKIPSAQAAEVINIYRKDPVKFFTNILDVNKEHIWDKMQEVVESIRDYECTAVKAGHAVSKTYTAARAALWFLYTHYPATVITTAPSHKQVEQVLWREIRQAYGSSRVPLGGQITKTKLDLGEKWFAYGFSTRPDTVTQEATGFQGFHNDNMLIIFDEAAGILKQIWEAADALMTAGNVRFLAIGNPTSSRGEFPACFKSKRYNCITISVKDTPNYKSDKEVVPGVSGRKFESVMREKYGENSNQYKARVLGEIPDEDIESIITVSDYEAAHHLTKLAIMSDFEYFGCDPADGGDETVVYHMCNTDIINRLVMTRNNNTMVTSGQIWSWMNKVCKQEEKYIGIDANGIGKGIADRLEEFGAVVYKIISQETKDVPDYYYNRKAQVWIEGAERFRLRECMLSYEDSLLKEQLTMPRQLVKSGKIIIESREDCMENYGWSPDRATAYLFGLFIKDTAELQYKRLKAGTPGKLKSKFGYREKAASGYMTA